MVESAKPAESLQADIANKVIEAAKETDFQMSKEVNTKEAEDVLNKNKGADDEMVLEKEVDNTEKSLCLQLEDTIVFPASANPPDAENIQEDIANKIPEADVAKETDGQVSKEVNNNEAEDCLNTSDSNMKMSKVSEKVEEEEVKNAEKYVFTVLEDTIVLPTYVKKRK